MTVAIVVYKGLKLVVYRMLTNEDLKIKIVILVLLDKGLIGSRSLKAKTDET